MEEQMKRNHRYIVSWERSSKDRKTSKRYRKTLRSLEEAKKLAGWIESHKRTCSVQITHWWDGYMCSNFREVIKPVWKKTCEI